MDKHEAKQKATLTQKQIDTMRAAELLAKTMWNQMHTLNIPSQIALLSILELIRHVFSTRDGAMLQLFAHDVRELLRELEN